jgi:hypothetical protein
VELAAAVLLAVLLLSASWSWLWAAEGAARRGTDAAEASTSVAFARRLLLRELRSALALAPPDAGGGCTSSSLVLLEGDETAVTTVRYAWNAERSVLWRGTSSNYVAEDVAAFTLTYQDASGASMKGEPLSDEQVRAVRTVGVSITVRHGSASVSSSWQVRLGSAL